MYKYHRLPLSLATKRQHPWIGAVAIILALIGFAIVILGYLKTRALVEEAERALEDKLVHVRTALVPRQLSPVELEARNKVEKLRGEIDGWLALPWDELLREFETNLGSDVVLLALEPDVASRTVIVTAEARNLSAVMDYFDSMTNSARFGDVFIKQHEVQVGDPERPVRFVMSLRWLAPSNSAQGKL